MGKLDDKEETVIWKQTDYFARQTDMEGEQITRDRPIWEIGGF
jgi:hypothetical protein